MIVERFHSQRVGAINIRIAKILNSWLLLKIIRKISLATPMKNTR